VVRRGACLRKKWQYLFVAGTTAKSLLTRGVCLQNVPTYKRYSPMKGAINIGVVQKVGKCYSLDKSLSAVKVVAKQTMLFTG